MAQEIARELDISPWDALLAAVRISAFKVRSYEEQVAKMIAQHGADCQRPGELGYAWVLLSQQERRHLLRAAKAAVDKASKSLRGLRVAEVAELDMHLEDGKVLAYRAKVKLSFKYED